jgi:hypothetical protein
LRTPVSRQAAADAAAAAAAVGTNSMRFKTVIPVKTYVINPVPVINVYTLARYNAKYVRLLLLLLLLLLLCCCLTAAFAHRAASARYRCNHQLMDTDKLCGDWSISTTCNTIVTQGFTRVALQFPDDLLHDAPLVAAALQTALTERGSAAKVTTINVR